MSKFIIGFIIGSILTSNILMADGDYGPFTNLILWIQSLEMRIDAIEVHVGIKDILHDAK